MTIRQDSFAFVVFVAFAISAFYQAYRAALMEVPERDAFGVAMGVGFLALVGISALVLTGRRWAWWSPSSCFSSSRSVFFGIARSLRAPGWKPEPWVRPGGWREVPIWDCSSFRAHLRAEPARRASGPG